MISNHGLVSAFVATSLGFQASGDPRLPTFPFGPLLDPTRMGLPMTLLSLKLSPISWSHNCSGFLVDSVMIGTRVEIPKAAVDSGENPDVVVFSLTFVVVTATVDSLRDDLVRSVTIVVVSLVEITTGAELVVFSLVVV